MDELNQQQNNQGGLLDGINNIAKTARAAGTTLKTARKAAFLFNPTVLLIGLAVLVILVIIVIILLLTGGSSTPNPKPKTIPGLELFKSGPSSVEDQTKTITYTISGKYTGTNEVVLSDPIPSKTKFVAASGKYLPDQSKDGTIRAVSWSFKENGVLEQATNPKTYSFTITVQPEENNIWVVNKVSAFAQGGGAIDPVGNSIDDIFVSSAKAYGIPYPFLKAIAATETQVLSYQDNEVAQFSDQDWWQGKVDSAPSLKGNDPLILRGYAYNTCAYMNGACAAGSDVRGAMQFEVKTWGGVASAIESNVGHPPDRRYVKDVILGAALHIKQKADYYDSRFHFSDNPQNWNEQQVKAIARVYCGGNPDADVTVAACRQSGMGYDEVVWRHYLEFNK